MTDYTQAVYDYLLTLGEPGDEVRTRIWPYLQEKFDLTPEEATRARRQGDARLDQGGSHRANEYQRSLRETSQVSLRTP